MDHGIIPSAVSSYDNSALVAAGSHACCLREQHPVLRYAVPQPGYNIAAAHYSGPPQNLDMMGQQLAIH